MKEKKIINTVKELYDELSTIVQYYPDHPICLLSEEDIYDGITYVDLYEEGVTIILHKRN